MLPGGCAKHGLLILAGPNKHIEERHQSCQHAQMPWTNRHAGRQLVTPHLPKFIVGKAVKPFLTALKKTLVS